MKVIIKKVQRRIVEIDPKDEKKLLKYAEKYRKENIPDDLDIYLEDEK